VGLGAEEWGGAEGATGYPVSPGAALGPLEQAAGDEDKRWLQSGRPRSWLDSGSQGGRDGVEAETTTPAPGCFSRHRASSTICAALWRRRKAVQNSISVPCRLQPSAEVSDHRKGRDFTNLALPSHLTRPSLNAPGACGSWGEMPSVFIACILPPGSLFPSGCLIQGQSRWCPALKRPSEARPCPPTPTQCSLAHLLGRLRPGISWGAGPRYAREPSSLPQWPAWPAESAGVH